MKKHLVLNASIIGSGKERLFLLKIDQGRFTEKDERLDIKGTRSWTGDKLQKNETFRLRAKPS